ncbi:glycosyltransferase [Desulfomonile tiedjei]|uniref:Glycosyltransferase n=1 Tax=Desulfomonile tiedjei (strain ATCC 49306 / DSM 6799 / DCB-1) TaxID=706587 RepID=I4C269_DESTA|nr:glycosyltransferase [Desulfomonile tiedjei]AFM23660.1 glycosyltransferase [Desulfomonile tiedjei DSM 6799]
MRVLHILHRSVPGTHGYAIRSLEIVRNQLAKGIEPLVVTSPSQAPSGSLDAEQSEMIEGVRYFRTCGTLLKPSMEVEDKNPLRSMLRIVQNAALLTRTWYLARHYRPQIIHAHSPFTCGLAGNTVGKLLGIRTVYEMRGIWEDSHVGRYNWNEESIRYRGVRMLENIALRTADCCCVICDALAEEVASRGVAPDKINVVPNGVDLTKFTPGPPDEMLKKKWGLAGKIIMGYIGSFFRYEGLDVLMKATILLADGYPNLRLLLVGDGEETSLLKEMAANAGISDRVVFTGRVKHNEVSRFYKLFDFLVLPRKETRETRLVTPLKPMEIMAMEKPLIASNIGGHREIVSEGINGILFAPEDPSDLAAKCRQLIDDEQFRYELGRKGQVWVEKNRNWNTLIERYSTLYENLCHCAFKEERSGKHFLQL